MPTKVQLPNIKKPETAQPSAGESKDVAQTSLKVRKAVDVLLSWEAAERIWRPKTQIWYLKYAILILVLIFVAARMGYYVAIVALCAFMVLWFLQGSIQPWILKHKLTTKGVFTNNTMISWSEIKCFWFAEKDNHTILYLDFPKDTEAPRLTLLVSEGLDQEIFDICSRYLTYGDLDIVEYNIFTQLIYGKYIPITRYVPDLDDIR